MEVKFTVSKKQDNKNSSFSLLTKDCITSTLSSQNVLVFIKLGTKTDTFKHKTPVYDVCVCDLNTCHEPHVILESTECISHLKFSPCGDQLLVVTRQGMVMMLMKGPALNSWTNCHKSDWHGEDILYINFFHAGVKPTLQTSEAKVNAAYSDKIILQSHKPTLTTFINTPVPGYFAISASGIILLCTLDGAFQNGEETRVALGPRQGNYSVAAAAFCPNGSIQVAAWKPDIVKMWKIELSYAITDEESNLYSTFALSVNVQDTTSLVPGPVTDQNSSTSSWRTSSLRPGCQTSVIKLMFPEIEDPKSILVGLIVENNFDNSPSIDGRNNKNCPISYVIHRYKLLEKSRPVMSIFNVGKKGTKTVPEWTFAGEWQSMTGEIVDIGSPVRQLLPSSQLHYVFTVSTIEGTIYSVNRDTMAQLNSYNINNTRLSEDTTQTKKLVTRYGMSLTHTWTGLSVLVLDNFSNIYFISIFRPSDSGQMWQMYIMILLELALVTGQDWIDLLISIPHNNIVSLADRLTEMFSEQPLSIIQQFNTRFLVMKNSIYRLSNNFICRSIECRLQAQMSSVLRLFRSLRHISHDISNRDKNIDTAVQSFIENRSNYDHLDIDNAIETLLCTVNINDIQIDPSLAKELQLLLQLTADLGLYLILMLAQNPKHEPSRNFKIIQDIREILFVSRIWHRYNRLVLPQMLKKTESIDIWHQLYKLLTRLSQILPAEPDVNFIDECIQLETQVVCREVPLFILPRGVLGQIASSAQFPLQIHFDIEEMQPISPPGSIGRPLDGALPAPCLIDPLYNHFIGYDGDKIQNCTRCWGIRGSWWNEGDSLWEQQWNNVCQCSGHWAPHPNILHEGENPHIKFFLPKSTNQDTIQ